MLEEGFADVKGTILKDRKDRREGEIERKKERFFAIRSRDRYLFVRIAKSRECTFSVHDGGLFLQATLLPSRGDTARSRATGVDTYVHTRAETSKVAAEKESERENFLLQPMRRRVGRYK